MKFWKLLLACLLALTLVVTPIIASATEVTEGEKQEVVDANPDGGKDDNANPTGGTTEGDDPVGGDPVGGDPVGGDPVGGDPVGGDPDEGDPNEGDPNEGDPNEGDPNEGDPNEGDPNEGNPEGHTHIWGAWNVTRPDSMHGDGYAYRKCTAEGCDAIDDVVIEWKGFKRDCGDHHFKDWEATAKPNSCEEWRYCDGSNDYCWYFSLKNRTYSKMAKTADPGDDYVWCGLLECMVEECRYVHQWGDLQEDENGRLVRICKKCSETTYEQAAGHTWGSWYIERKVDVDVDGLQVRVCTDPDCDAKQSRTIKYVEEEFDCGEGNHKWGEWRDGDEDEEPCLKRYRWCVGNDKDVYFVGGEDIDDVQYIEVSEIDGKRPEGGIWCGSKYCMGYEAEYEHKWGDLEVVTYPNENDSGCDGLMARFCEVCKVIDEESKRVIKWYGEIDDCTKSGLFDEHNWDEWITREEDPEYIQWLIDEEGFSKCLVEIRWCLGHDGKIIYNPATDEYRVVNVEVYGIPDEYINCGYIFCDTHEAKYEHDWGEWKVTKKPTTSKKGIEERVCKRCDAKETREIAKLKSESTMPKTGVETIPAAALQVSGLISAIGYALLKRRSLHR